MNPHKLPDAVLAPLIRRLVILERSRRDAHLLGDDAEWVCLEFAAIQAEIAEIVGVDLGGKGSGR
jgi:hypothetical protein